MRAAWEVCSAYRSGPTGRAFRGLGVPRDSPGAIFDLSLRDIEDDDKCYEGAEHFVDDGGIVHEFAFRSLECSVVRDQWHYSKYKSQRITQPKASMKTPTNRPEALHTARSQPAIFAALSAGATLL